MRSSIILPAALATLALITSPAIAGNGKGKAKGLKHASPSYTAPCPPGLAKMNPPCIPPGQAKKRYPNYTAKYAVGDRIYGDYRIIRDPERYRLRSGYLYYLAGQEVFRISPETGRVLAFMGLADALLK
ncbi:hypothetical protein [Sulfitobacter sediminilitoris]|uniref:hypothetical protein n=1 Tax=Sulfitobacter sediminilitoris TaxID=2698830 RepID=UPI001F380C91|nr:hypothetical protein [Sulfitobacter sediminilitoris]